MNTTLLTLRSSPLLGSSAAGAAHNKIRDAIMELAIVRPNDSRHVETLLLEGLAIFRPRHHFGT